MKENHDKFISHLEESSAGVFTAAYYLYSKGLDVMISGLRKRGYDQDPKDFQDDGDLFVFKNDKKYRIEVKNLSCDFTSSEDWQFKEFIVCASHSYDNADLKPYAYMILNKNRTHMAEVKGDTHKHWSTIERKDSRYYNYSQKFYICDLDLIKWIKL